MKTKLLFVCSGNRDRSPTAEDLFKNSDTYEAKSAGTHDSATQKITQDLVSWSDIIFVMSERLDGHLSFLGETFDLTGKEVHDLDIPDEYDRGDPALVAIIREKLRPYIHF